MFVIESAIRQLENRMKYPLSVVKTPNEQKSVVNIK